MTPLTQALVATFLTSALSLSGLVVVRWSARAETQLLGFAAGMLLATAFLDLLPEAVTAGPIAGVLAAALGAMVAFFLLERALQALHRFEESHTVTSRYLILIGDGVHNFVDGVAIAASFLVGPWAGVTTTLAIAAHEIPQEIADYGVLVSGRFTRPAALALNFLSGLTAMVGAAICFGFQAHVETHLTWFIGATAGMFVYIAAADLIPELHHSGRRGSWADVLPFLAGIALSIVLTRLLPH